MSVIFFPQQWDVYTIMNWLGARPEISDTSDDWCEWMEQDRAKHQWELIRKSKPRGYRALEGDLRKHLAWALDEISGGDYSKTPKHDCEFKTNPEKGHCDFCWGFWAAVGACFPEKFQTDINDD